MADLPAGDTGVAQVLITVQSVVVVYHLSTLQAWLQSLWPVEADAEALLDGTGEGDLRRLRLQRRARSQIKSFPTMQVSFLFVLIASVGALVVRAGIEMSDTVWYYVELPGVMLVLLFVASSVATYVTADRRIRNVITRLGDDGVDGSGQELPR